MGAERLDDVVLICKDCHDAAHERNKKFKRKGLWNATSRVGRKVKKKIAAKRAKRTR